MLLTNDCQQRGSTDYALGVAHNTSHILSGKRHVEPTIGWLCVLRFNSEKSVIVAALTLASPSSAMCSRDACQATGSRSWTTTSQNRPTRRMFRRASISDPSGVDMAPCRSVAILLNREAGVFFSRKSTIRPTNRISLKPLQSPNWFGDPRIDSRQNSNLCVVSLGRFVAPSFCFS